MEMSQALESMHPLTIASLPSKESVLAKTGEKLGNMQFVSAELGLKSLFVWQETLSPGRRSSSPHWHTKKEEMIMVLSGVVVVRVGDQTIELSAGQAFAFFPGTAQFHEVSNDGVEAAVFMGIASVVGDDEVIYQQKHS